VLCVHVFRLVHPLPPILGQPASAAPSPTVLLAPATPGLAACCLCLSRDGIRRNFGLYRTIVRLHIELLPDLRRVLRTAPRPAWYAGC